MSSVRIGVTMSKLSVVVSVLGQHELATFGITKLLENITEPSTDIIIIDNGNDYIYPLPSPRVYHHAQFENVGVYPTFPLGFEFSDADVVAFFHSDLIVVEKGFDDRILDAFAGDPRLGLVGFVGSNEIDWHGGRGGGTTSNFQGLEYTQPNTDGESAPIIWRGSPARDHGKSDAGISNAAVVDGCAMVIRRSSWEKIGYRVDFPPHHFYDRLISTQMLEAGYKVKVLGIACDHISGQTVGGKQYYDFAKAWCEANGLFGANNPDQVVYAQAEHMWLMEYRDQKKLVPIKV